MDRVTLKIPRQLYVTLRDMTTTVGFSSVNELVVFVMLTVAMGDNVPDSASKLHQRAVRLRRKLRRLKRHADMLLKNRQPGTPVR